MIADVLGGILGVIAGAMFGVEVRAPFRWVGRLSAILLAAIAAAAGLLLDLGSAGIGVLFGILATVTAVLVSAEGRRDHPGFAGERYWRRVLLVMSPRQVKEERPDE